MMTSEYILIKAPKDYPGKVYNIQNCLYCSEHIYVYWKQTGILPKTNEVIHHIDGNKHNNDITNLQLMSVEEHNKLHHKKYDDKVMICPECGQEFVWTYKQQAKHYSSDKFRKQTILGKYCGPFCSKSCAGRYTRRLQLQHL